MEHFVETGMGVGMREHYLDENLKARKGFLKMQLSKTCLSTDG